MSAKTKAVIFDFGHVIINIDVPKTYQAFADLCGKSAAKVEQLFQENQLFRRYEIGLYDDDEFREAVRQILGFPFSDAEVDTAWNALLLDIPPARIDFLLELKRRVPIYLLSNTNTLHIRAAEQILHKTTGIASLQDLFTHAFFSYDLGLWKPDPAIYEAVLSELGLLADEVLFLDDNAANVESARRLGIPTEHIIPGQYTLLEVTSYPSLEV